MAIRRKTDLKQTYRSKPRRTPPTAPLDLVRNPNFDSAMAQQDYANLMRDQRARLATERGQSGNQDFIDSRDPNRKYAQDMVDYIDPATGERTSRTRGVVPAPGSRFVPANQAGLIGQQSTNSTAGYVQVDPNRAGYMPVDPNTNMPSLMPIQPPQGQQGAMASQYQNPQGQQQQMQNYQNFLQQGMQNSNTMNQGAMNNFANMQPGMQATQTASTTTPNQTMPVAGMGSQKPKAIQLPRTFSTRNNQSARFA